MNFRAFLNTVSDKINKNNSTIIQEETSKTYNKQITTRGKKRVHCHCFHIIKVKKLKKRASAVNHIHDKTQLVAIYTLSKLLHNSFENT